MKFEWGQLVKYTAPDGKVYEAKYLRPVDGRPHLHRVKVKGWLGFTSGHVVQVKESRLAVG